MSESLSNQQRNENAISDLGDFFQVQLEHLDQLHEIIGLEREALSRLETSEVIRLSEIKSEIMEKIEHCVQQGQSIFFQLQQAANIQNPEAVLRASDPSGSLLEDRNRILDLTERCMSENRKNSSQLKLQNQRVHAALAAVRGEVHSPDCYTASGENQSQFNSRFLGRV